MHDGREQQKKKKVPPRLFGIRPIATRSKGKIWVRSLGEGPLLPRRLGDIYRYMAILLESR